VATAARTGAAHGLARRDGAAVQAKRPSTPGLRVSVGRRYGGKKGGQLGVPAVGGAPVGRGRHRCALSPSYTDAEAGEECVGVSRVGQVAAGSKQVR